MTDVPTGEQRPVYGLNDVGNRCRHGGIYLGHVWSGSTGFHYYRRDGDLNQSFQVMTIDIHAMDENIDVMSVNVHNMNGDMNDMSTNISGRTDDIETMAASVPAMTNAVLSMAAGMDRMVQDMARATYAFRSQCHTCGALHSRSRGD